MSSNLPKPRYTIWQAVSTALALAMRAIEEIRTLAREPGPKGEKGEPGEPGAGLEAMEVDFDGDRTFVHRYKIATGIVEKKFVLTHPIYRGVYQDGTTYQRGDMVTYDGSTWHRNMNGSPGIKPGGDAQKVWVLAVKKGRDGKDGSDGKDGKMSTDHIPFGDK